jgi:acyl carrier protein
MATTQQEVYGKVRDVLVDALGVDADEVVTDAQLVSDLGAESIDFLDIAFRLEKAFGIKIEQGELFPDNVLNDPKYVADGKITDVGLAELRKRLPHANLRQLEASRKVDDFSSVFTVDALVRFVQSKLTIAT